LKRLKSLPHKAYRCLHLNPHLSLWDIFTKAGHFSLRKIKVLTQTDRRELKSLNALIDNDFDHFFELIRNKSNKSLTPIRLTAMLLSVHLRINMMTSNNLIDV
jgi:hypothetical protein